MKKLLLGILLLTLLYSVGCSNINKSTSEKESTYVEPQGTISNILMVTHPHGSSDIITSETGI